MILAGAALVAMTLLVLALGGRLRPTWANVPIGAIAAIAIPVVGVMWLISLQPLNRWMSAQPDAESFAPNLVAPAPAPAVRECPSVGPSVDVLVNHGFGRGPAGAPGRLQWIEGHVPRWLPDGFGLVTWDNWRVSLGVWADERCRWVQLVLFEGNPDSPRWDRFFSAVDEVGDWTVMAGRGCRRSAIADGSCLGYLAWSYEQQGEGEQEVLGLHLEMGGIDRDEGDRIALGIPV